VDTSLWQIETAPAVLVSNQEGNLPSNVVDSQLNFVSQEVVVPSYVADGQFSQEGDSYVADTDLVEFSPKFSQEGGVPSYVADNQTEMASEVNQEVETTSYVNDEQTMGCSKDVQLIDNFRSTFDGGKHPVNFRSTSNPCILNAEAEVFVARDDSRIHPGRMGVSILDDICHVQRVQAGGVGVLDMSVATSWNNGPVAGHRTDISTGRGWSGNDMPFHGVESIPDVLGIAPKQIQKVKKLLDLEVRLPKGTFTDKVLPAPNYQLEINKVFTPDYFAALHQITAAPGHRADGTPFPVNTPNHVGARVSLPHTRLKLDRWRFHLIGYENAELVQFLEFGFPLGLLDSAKLDCQTRNHGSSYMWFDWVDKFVAAEVKECGLTGPFKLTPWWDTIVSPLMTAHKKPLDRRTVYDATYGEGSLNNATPGDTYMGQPIDFTYPKIEDYRLMILRAGHGAWMWKRDLSRFFLQLPLDPVEYNKVGVVWRGLFFFFVCLAFGLRHSGLNGQRVTDAVSWILQQLGLQTDSEQIYQVCNYVDDLGGVEATEERATAAFEALAWLLDDLGLQESKKKAVAPTTLITYLGIQFNSKTMEMSVPPEKMTEVKLEIARWLRKSTISKRELQSLLGKLFWVARVVKYARAFMGRLLEQLRSLSKVHDGKKVKFGEESKKDVKWWGEYLEHFNGVTMIINEEPIRLTYEQFLDCPDQICAGDATPTGGGAWHGSEYWCGELPLWLQDPQIPIHIKEFWILIVSAKLWGETWSGKTITIFCDNDAVCDTVTYRKPRDQALLSLLREFLYLVVTRKFFPIVRKIGTKENAIADHISRRFDEVAAAEVFAKFGLQNMMRIRPKTTFFNLSSSW
jgi:hypothetical protein